MLFIIYLALTDKVPVAHEQSMTPKVQSILGQTQEHNIPFTLAGTTTTPIARITARIAGTINHVYAHEGQNISLNTLLITLNPKKYQITLAQKESTLKGHQDSLTSLIEEQKQNQTIYEHQSKLLNLSKIQMNRYETLYSKKFISDHTLDTAKNNYHKQAIATAQQTSKLISMKQKITQMQTLIQDAQYATDLAQINLNHTQIRNKISGYITHINVHEGDVVQIAQPLISIADPQSFEITLTLPQSMNTFIKKYKTEALLEKYPHIIFAKPLLLGHTGESGMGQSAIFKPQQKVTREDIPKVGQHVTLNLTLKAVPSIRLPISAIYDLNHVFIIKNNKLSSSPIQIISNTSEYALITPNAQLENKHILVTHLMHAYDGMAVHSMIKTPESTH